MYFYEFHLNFVFLYSFYKTNGTMNIKKITVPIVYK